jgi:septum formation protein
MNLKFPLILASKSPRRQELLQQAGFSFKVRTRETNESFPAELPAEKVARYLAEKKAAAFKEELDEEILLTADTTVLVDSQILNKPASREEAQDMLQMLSGLSHKVVSGVCLLHKGEMHSFDDITEVCFRKISEEEINFYIDTYQPYDKAGGYGIQEWIGLVAIEKIVGSYYTVMGLPVHEVYRQLKPYGI